MTPLHLPGLLARVPGDIAFQPFREGVEIAPLQGPGEDGAALALLRYRPGASVPLHEHMGLLDRAMVFQRHASPAMKPVLAEGQKIIEAHIATLEGLMAKLDAMKDEK